MRFNRVLSGGTTSRPDEIRALLYADYLNIHTTLFPGDEIRGQVLSGPEPGTILLVGSGLIGIAGYGRGKFLKK